MTTPIEPASTERAAFEKWLMDVHMLDSVWNEQRNCFDDFPAHLAFKAWQAALAQTAPAEVVGWPALDNMGKWLSAALDDDTVCAEMKADINAWFASVEAIRSLVSTWRQDVANDESLDRYSRAELACASELEKAIGKPIAHYQGMGQEIRPLYTHPTPIEPAKRHDHWRVSVETIGELIVAIEPEMLAGREPSEADYDAIRTAANHLLAFAGTQTAPAEVVEEPIGYASEYGLEQLAKRTHHYCISVLKEKCAEFPVPLYTHPTPTQAEAKEAGTDAVDSMIDFILSDETPVGPEDQPNIDMFNRAIESAKGRLHNETLVETAYKAAVSAMRGTSADIGAGELDRIVRAIVSTLSSLKPASWFPISQADNGIAYIIHVGEMQIGNSYPVWVRDADGRVYEALWSDNGKKAYWWDIEGESPVDPVEFMPHPLALRALLTEGEAR